ncbi:(2Fe-2S)-binding protein [Cryptosporangium minutisporangium]|uniref:(2Fe-2S)-binding protein n=1 Tax=Cryptosporangium minutisporangium TaxID=113569 RepID=UPI0035E6D6C7
MVRCDELYRRVAISVPSLAYTVAPGGGPRLPGSLLTDPEWLSAQVDASARRWGGASRRVAGTLWWYSTSSTLVAGPIVGLLVTGWVPALDDVTFELAHGSVAGVRASRMLGRGPDVLAAAAGPALGAVIAPLARVSGVGEGALRAVASDSVANRALDVARGPAGEALAERVAAVGGLPMPRFVEIPGAGPYLRRSSCCLIYAVPGAASPEVAKCASCPRQRPEVRERRMSGVAMGQRGPA